MIIVLFKALFYVLVITVGVIIGNQFSKKKVALDREYWFRSGIAFVLIASFIYFLDYVWDRL